MSPCPGSCNRAHRTDPINVPAIPGTPIWCADCVTRIRHALHALPKLYAQLELDKTRGTRDTGGEKLSGAKSRPSPSAAADEQDALVHLLTYWEDALREMLELPWRRAQLAAGVRRYPITWCRRIIGPARNGEPWPIVVVITITAEERLHGHRTAEAAVVDSAERFLRRHLDAALRHEAHAVELGRDLLNARHRLQQLTKTDPQRRRMPLPCPRCELKSLVHEGGTEHVTCGNSECGRIMSIDEYDDMATDLAKSQPRRASA